MHALYIIVPILAVLALAYRYYSAFLTTRVMSLDDTRVTPAHARYDGANFHPTSRWVLFGHHFAAIAGAGPLVGPVFAAQFGYAPGLMWLVAGVCIAGAVQDFFWLWASTRRGGRSLADIARTEVGPVAGTTAAISILFILVIAMAGLGIVVVNALAESAWGTFTIFMTIPIALFMGFYLFRWRKGCVREATVIGVTVMMLAVVFGKNVAESSLSHWFLLSKHQITIAMALYTMAASVLPVWMLLTPRAYLSTFMKIGTIGLLVIGVMILNPKLQAPAFSQYIGGGGPVIPGPLFPFVFITIACGAISGFHALVSTGTTSKMIECETDMRPIDYGAMLVEGLVGAVAIITACALHPNDYYAISTSPATFSHLGLTPVNLPQLQSDIGEVVAERPGLGIFHLDRQHQRDLADVRRRQSAARVGGDGGGNHDPDQCGPGAVCVGDVHPALLCVGDHADGRLHERARQLLADGGRSGPGAPRAGVRELHLHRDHDGVRGGHSRRNGAPLPAGADRPNPHDRPGRRSGGISRRQPRRTTRNAQNARKDKTGILSASSAVSALIVVSAG